LLVAGIAAAVLAITDTGPFADPPTEEERIEATVREFFGAAADGDSRTFCALLTKQACEELRVTTAQRLQIDECPNARRSSTRSPTPSRDRLEVRFVSVSGRGALPGRGGGRPAAPCCCSPRTGSGESAIRARAPRP
jgi:hypothetical protein